MIRICKPHQIFLAIILVCSVNQSIWATETQAPQKPTGLYATVTAIPKKCFDWLKDRFDNHPSVLIWRSKDLWDSKKRDVYKNQYIQEFIHAQKQLCEKPYQKTSKTDSWSQYKAQWYQAPLSDFIREHKYPEKTGYCSIDNLLATPIVGSTCSMILVGTTHMNNGKGLVYEVIKQQELEKLEDLAKEVKQHPRNKKLHAKLESELKKSSYAFPNYTFTNVSTLLKDIEKHMLANQVILNTHAGAIQHEIGHSVNKHILKLSLIALSLGYLVSKVVKLYIPVTWRSLRGWLGLGICYAAMQLDPIFPYFSRPAEREADDFIANDPNILACMKLWAEDLAAQREQPPKTRWQKIKRAFNRLLATHPSCTERAKRFGKRLELLAAQGIKPTIQIDKVDKALLN